MKYSELEKLPNDELCDFLIEHGVFFEEERLHLVRMSREELLLHIQIGHAPEEMQNWFSRHSFTIAMAMLLATLIQALRGDWSGALGSLILGITSLVLGFYLHRRICLKEIDAIRRRDLDNSDSRGSHLDG